jgi:tetratricopeptide (TPR) repeat protein
VIAAYSHTLSVPFLFDDVPSIVDNPSIRHLPAALFPPGDSTVGGRPTLNVSLAINYALGGNMPRGYHVTNIVIHLMAALVLFGVMRRTLRLTAENAATSIAFCAALLWAVHPLDTESVTYVIQRAESLMGLFYLLTLYCFIRGAIGADRGRAFWYSLCVAACLLGMGTKEVMVSAPLIVLLYDRTFIAGTFSGAWRERRWVYMALAATWLALPFLVMSTHGRNGSAGFGNGVSPLDYGITQLPAIVHYLRLCFWPTPLIFDYGSALDPISFKVAVSGLIVVGLIAATIWAFFRHPRLGFLGATFFAILVPSSSIVPVITETMAEHRMYLALVPVVVLFVAGLHRLLPSATLPVCVAIGAVFCFATFERNGDYASEENIWRITAAELPTNERAQNNFGNMLARDPRRVNEAIAHFQEAIRLQPGYADAHYNLGLTLHKVPGRDDEAIKEYRLTLRLKPDYVDARNNLGNALESMGRLPEAMAQFQEALRLEPADAEAHYNLGNGLVASGRTIAAIAQYKEAIRLRPDYVEAHFNLGNSFVSNGDPSEAIEQYEAAIRLRPDYADARFNLANALDSVGRREEAIAEFEETVRLKPDFAEARNYLACDLATIPTRIDEAIAQFQKALLLKPDYLMARFNLGNAFSSLGRTGEAITQYEEALRLKPDYVPALCNLGIAMKTEGRIPEAIAKYEEALRLSPDDAKVHLNFAVALLRTPGGTDDAIGHLHEVLRLQPGNATAAQLLARISRSLR